MKEFRSLAMVRHPVDDVFHIVRDRLSELVPMVDDVESIETISRDEADDGVIRLVNRWSASQRIPEVVGKALGTKEIAWIDRNEWDAAAMECRWWIEPLVMTEHIECHGITTYEPAMGGRGCRVTLTGTFELSSSAFDRFSTALRRPVTTLIEQMVSTIIPRGTRKLVEAAAMVDSAQT